MSGNGVYQALGQNLPKPRPFYEALNPLLKWPILFLGLGRCGNDTLSISLIQVLLNFIVSESTNAAEDHECVHCMAPKPSAGFFQSVCGASAYRVGMRLLVTCVDGLFGAGWC